MLQEGRNWKNGNFTASASAAAHLRPSAGRAFGVNSIEDEVSDGIKLYEEGFKGIHLVSNVAKLLEPPRSPNQVEMDHVPHTFNHIQSRFQSKFFPPSPILTVVPLQQVFQTYTVLSIRENFQRQLLPVSVLRSPAPTNLPKFFQFEKQFVTINTLNTFQRPPI